MRGFRSKGIKVVVLVSVLLLVPAFSFVAVQGQSQSENSLVCRMLLPYVNSPSGQPIAKAVTWADVTFSNTSSYSNMEIILNGNLTIASPGVLRLSNVTLRVNCSSDGEHRIEVQSGGALYINDTDGDPTTRGDSSNITAYDTDYSFLFWVDSGAVFQMNNSEVYYCGYHDFEWSYYKRGFWINANNTIIENNTFSDNVIGLVLDNAHHNTIMNNNFTDNEGGLGLYYSSDNTVIGNTARGGWLGGFYLWHSSDNNLTGNTAVDNDFGFMLDWISTTNNTLVGNVAVDNAAGFKITRGANHNNLTGNFAVNNSVDIFPDYGFYINSSSDNNLTGNTAVNSEYGFYVNASSNNNDLFDNDAVNCSVQGYFLGAGCVGNDLSGSVVSNFLRIRVVDRGGVPVEGVDVRVASDGVDVYASPGYGGSNATTGVDGFTGWIVVPYQRYSGVTPSALKVEAWAMGYGHRVVDMSTSHTETFTEKLGNLPLLFFIASQSSQNVPTVLIIGGLLGVTLAGLAAALYTQRRKT